MNAYTNDPFLSLYPTCNRTADAVRVKRQSSGDDPKKEESFEQELCKDKDAGEWFRLVAGEGDNCRDVIQCTSSVSVMMIVGIQISSRTSALERYHVRPKVSSPPFASYNDTLRVCKPSVVRPVCTSTLRSRRATGKMP